MNISGDYSTNFKGISSEVLANINKMKPKTKKQVSQFREILDKSPYVDLIWHKDNLALKINKDIKDSFLGTNIVLKKGSIIENVQARYKDQGTYLDITINNLLENENNKKVYLSLDMSSFEDARSIHARFRGMNIPTLGALIDLSEKIRPFVQRIEIIMLDFLYKTSPLKRR